MVLNTYKNYFNAGILLINCRRWRKKLIAERFVDLLNRYKFRVVQDEAHVPGFDWIRYGGVVTEDCSTLDSFYDAFLSSAARSRRTVSMDMLKISHNSTQLIRFRSIKSCLIFSCRSYFITFPVILQYGHSYDEFYQNISKF